jgi:hypothetical protein
MITHFIHIIKSIFSYLWDKASGFVTGGFCIFYNYAHGNVRSESDTTIEKVHAITKEGPVTYIQHTDFIEQSMVWVGAIIVACITWFVMEILKENRKNPTSKVSRSIIWWSKLIE